eukprot:12345433-Ditylum_brightwellii.AAC.1
MSSRTSCKRRQRASLIWWKCHLGAKLCNIGDNEDEESNKEEEDNDKAEKKEEQGQSSTSATSLAGSTQDTYKS